MGGRMSYCATAQWWVEGKSQYTKSGFLTAKSQFQSTIPNDLTGKSIAVTGANSGLGFAVSKELAKRNATVHMLCRNRERGEKAQREIQEECKSNSMDGSNIQLHIVDVSDSQDVKRFANEFTRTNDIKLHTLINNAGVVPEKRMETRDGNEVSFATMAGGTFLLTSLLLPMMKRENTSRVVNVSSAGMYTTRLDVQNIQCDQDKKYDGVFAYAHAKRAQVILTRMFQEKYNSKNHASTPSSTSTSTSTSSSSSTSCTSTTTFHSCHPGWSDTPGVRGKSMEWFNKQMEGNLRSSDEGADTIIWLAVGEDGILDTNGGHFWFDRKIVREHMTMAWTREKEHERNDLWNKLCEMFQHTPEL
jgi:dehydrogenase/reductase SDR family protein 12